MSYRKLVRDKIPEIIKSNGEIPIVRVLSNDEYIIELEKKLLEECHEVLSASDENKTEELADLLEVIISIGKFYGITFDDILNICENKRLKRGGFEKKLYLDGVKK